MLRIARWESGLRVRRLLRLLRINWLVRVYRLRGVAGTRFDNLNDGHLARISCSPVACEIPSWVLRKPVLSLHLGVVVVPDRPDLNLALFAALGHFLDLDDRHHPRLSGIPVACIVPARVMAEPLLGFCFGIVVVPDWSHLDQSLFRRKDLFNLDF